VSSSPPSKNIPSDLHTDGLSEGPSYILQWRKSDGIFFEGGDDDTACGPKFDCIIHIIGHDKTSDTVEDNLSQRES